MRAIIILAAIALTHGAKLERAYLPPSSAGTAGGTGNFLQTPLSGPSGVRGPSGRSFQNSPSFENQYSQTGNGFGQSGNAYAQAGNDFNQAGNGFNQAGNGFTQTEAEYNNVNFNNFAQESRPERPRAAFERNAAILRQDNSNDGETYSYAYETENGIYAEENGVATNGVEAQGGYSYTGDDGQVYSVRYTADQNGFVPQGDHLPTPPPVPKEILRALEQNARDEANGIYDDGSYNEGKYASADNTPYNYQNAYTGNSDDAIVTNSALARSGNSRSFNAPSNAYGAPNAPADVPSTYGAPEARAFNAPGSNTVASTYGAPEARAFNAPGSNTVAPTYGAPEARAYNAPGSNAVAPTYGAPEARAYNAPGSNAVATTYNAPETRAYNAPGSNAVAPTYGAPEARAFNAPGSNAVTPTYGAPNAPAFNSNRNAPAFNAPIANAPLARNSATEKAYLPPLATQRGENRNAFGRRQQSFDARTGYKY